MGEKENQESDKDLFDPLLQLVKNQLNLKRQLAVLHNRHPEFCIYFEWHNNNRFVILDRANSVELVALNFR